MKKKKKVGIDHGFILPFKCTSCQARGQKLIEVKTSISPGDLFGLVVSIILSKERASWFFECVECGLETNIPSEETEVIKALNEQSQLFQLEKMTQDEYFTIVMETESKTIKDMYARSKSWECPSCQTDIPATFATCWNCGEECPNPEDLALFEGEAMDLNVNVFFGTHIGVKKS
jgi:hypothetical protein